MSDRFDVGDRVRVRLDDPVGHTRAPRYVRGHVGEVVERHGRYPLPDAVVAGEQPGPSSVYAVRFDAAQVWGEGEHTVTVNLWDEYLEPANGA
jgi:nitrile hydratase